MACSKSFQRSDDFFSNVLDIVCDKILEHLPICIAAQTSVLSKQWRRAWLSLKKLNFDADFWRAEARRSDWQKCSSIISSVLFHHNGPVHDFQLCIPANTNWDGTNLSQWICFLSKNGVQKIVITNCYRFTRIVDISPYIFKCSELVHLELNGFYLNSQPTDFSGFPKLKHLLLEDITFRHQNNFSSLVGSCRMLVMLKLVVWFCMDHIVIDAPSLQTLILNGDFQSLAFRNVRSLESISVHLKVLRQKILIVKTVNAVNLLASSCQLQSMEFNGQLFKLLAAGDRIMKSTSVTFKHLDKLCLSNINLNDLGVFNYLLYMIECCPYIKTLDISIIPDKNAYQPILDFNHNYKLDHLREVNIEGITGSSVELKLVEYLLAVSTCLENLFFKSGKCNTDSEMKMSRAMMRFPRASPKASLVCLE